MIHDVLVKSKACSHPVGRRSGKNSFASFIAIEVNVVNEG